MSYTFIDRRPELAALDRIWGSSGSDLVVVWGRRRTGKTRLLGRFVRGKRSVFYGATQQSSEAELRGLSDAVRSVLHPSGTDLLAHGDFPTWDVALTYLADRARQQRLLVVFDEFPFLVDGDPALPSIVQRFWDHKPKGTKLKLVLCGSAVATMERLQAERAPLFGRVDLRLHVRPFDYRDSARFVPRLTPAEKAVAFGVMGGMPVYLRRWRDDRRHVANLRNLFADPTSPLVDEGEFVLTSELPEASGYFRILHGIASGHRTYANLRRFADIDIQRQLDRLIELGLVERVVPVTENPARTKRVVYRIGDNFLSFWFRFIYRHRADIARGLGRELVDRSIVPGLDDYMGEAWEEMCRDFVRRAGAQRLGIRLSSVGKWWSRDHAVEIDIVGLDGRQVVLAGSAKWRTTAGPRDVATLARAAESLPNRADDVRLVLFAREKIHPDVRKDVLGFTAKDLFAGPG